ncbi:MAG: hypothetical protein ABI969_10545 [bacterium]
MTQRPIIRTERLILRGFAAADFDAYAAMIEDPTLPFTWGRQAPELRRLVIMRVQIQLGYGALFGTHRRFGMMHSVIRSFTRPSLTLTLVAIVAGTPTLRAQSTAVTNLHDQCQKAEQILKHEHSNQNAQLTWSAWFILECLDDAPDAIASAVVHAKEGSAADILSWNAAFELADNRLLARMQTLALNPHASVRKRRHAVALLVHYASPDNAFDARGADNPPHRGLVLSSIFDSGILVGAQPIM